MRSEAAIVVTPLKCTRCGVSSSPDGVCPVCEGTVDRAFVEALLARTDRVLLNNDTIDESEPEPAKVSPGRWFGWWWSR